MVLLDATPGIQASRPRLHRVDRDAQVEDLVASFGDLGIVGGQHQGAAAVDCLEHPGEGECPGVGVEFCGRLIGDQQSGLQGQRPRDGGALLLAARQLVDQLPCLGQQA